MNNLPRLCWSVAAILGLIGMIWGIRMAATGDHSHFTAHAHLNLLGWVGLALYGTYYHLSRTTHSRLAQAQVLCAILGSVVLTIGIVLVRSQGTPAIAMAGSLLVVSGAILFALITFIKPIRLTS